MAQDLINIAKQLISKMEELDNYLKSKKGYAIHISKLEVFDKLKKLEDFKHWVEVWIYSGMDCPPYVDDELRDLYNEVFDSLLDEPNTMYEYAHNIEVYSNLNYIVGECIARLTKDLIELKTKIEINKAIKTVEERNNWNEEGKKPAITYFEALATRFCEEDIKLLAQKESDLKRFKNAYTSVEEKLNALKKRMESIKYEEFNE